MSVEKKLHAASGWAMLAGVIVAMLVIIGLLMWENWHLSDILLQL